MILSRRRWSLSLAAISVGLLVYAWNADAQPWGPQLRVEYAVEQIAGRDVDLDCSYMGRGADAVTYPDYRPRPWVVVKAARCGQARSFALKPTVAAADALLVLTHEALHARRWAGARDERAVECQALIEVVVMARLLGGSGADTAAVAERAARFHEFEWGFTCPADDGAPVKDAA